MGFYTGGHFDACYAGLGRTAGLSAGFANTEPKHAINVVEFWVADCKLAGHDDCLNAIRVGDYVDIDSGPRLKRSARCSRTWSSKKG
jgi:hypothetical protein